MSRDLEKNVISIISQFRGRLADEWVDEYILLAEHNECGIALENLCDQLFEFDVVPTREELQEIKSLAGCLGIERKSIHLLATNSGVE